MRKIAFVFLWFFIAGCQDEEQSEYYGSLIDSEEGLVLTEAEHRLGFGRSDCSSCHIEGNFHLDRIERSPALDMQAVRNKVEQEGLESCQDCHGLNGL